MNFYKKACNQQLHNKVALFSYTIGYMYFINIPESLANSNNNWYKYYLNTNQIDKKTVNNIKSDDLKLDSIALNH